MRIDSYYVPDVWLRGCRDWRPDCPCKHRWVKPGQGIRLAVRTKALVAGSDCVYAPTAATLVLTVVLPDSTLSGVTPIVNDSYGLYHGDFVIPIGTPPGEAVYRWVGTGATSTSVALDEDIFHVLPLDY